MRVKACNFINKGTLAQVFSCGFCEIFKNNFFAEHPRTTASGNTLPHSKKMYIDPGFSHSGTKPYTFTEETLNGKLHFLCSVSKLTLMS